ncbi:MAG TPA: DNA mismatch repair endonuclease MutL, partial [Candidatus Eisenbacteria bacterium]|nr:DNA mismatch repair endonuclease MutL [Candidatus Eisenbacteria bacterium]
PPSGQGWYLSLMSAIRILPAEVVNQIAAGEVIERPASIVKELVENSLDAGATRVRIEVEEGGRKRVRVSDDGRGLGADDLPLAFAPHATSKLSTADDLLRVKTFGFRGEALASIGAVARVSIVSRVRGNPEGSELVVDCGRSEGLKPAASPEGTTVDVRNLFHEMPGRRKFLRSPDVEMGHVEEAVTRFGVAHPAVRFELVADGIPRFTLPPAGDLRERLGSFFDRELVDALVEATSEDPAASFRALAAPPKFARLSLKGQFVYLNGRFIRDRVLTRAINEAFREMVPHGRYPVAFLFLEVAPGEVDVNVHPTKIEVRFRNVWRLHDRIVAALREKLLSSDLAPHLRPGLFSGPRAGGPSPEAIVEYFSRAAPGAAVPAGTPIPLVSSGRRCFQLHDRYIVEEADDGIRVIDQHALHERVLLEEIRRQYKSADVPKQLLLLPAMAEVTAAERARLEEHAAVLESMGLLIDDFGPSSVAVRAVPALLKDADPAGLVRDLLDRIEEHGEAERAAGHAVPMIDAILEFLACRAAVKFGDRLEPEELSRLLSDAEGMDYSATCAHGRPTAVKLTLDDLERFFKRRGS